MFKILKLRTCTIFFLFLEQTINNPLKFTATDLISITSILKDVALGLIELAYPDSRPSLILYTNNVNPNAQTTIWSHLLKVNIIHILIINFES